MLAIEVSFLLGRYVAADFRDRDRAEWPPHPSRLFSALVAATYEMGLGESARAALLWLERQPPPKLCADHHAPQQTPVSVFVPVNDPKGSPLPQRTERQPRGFPSVMPSTIAVGDMPSAYFIWEDAAPDAVLTGLLQQIAGAVSYLGSSRSPVRVRLCNEPPAPNWLPDDDGEAVLRVPSEGRLQSLEWHHQQGLRPSAGAFQRYRPGARHDATPAPSGVFGEMVVYRLKGPVGMEIQTTLKLTDTMRNAVMRQAQDALGSVPEVLSGHDATGKPTVRPHAAYIALPFVSEEQRHADGHILGMAVVFPRDLPPSERRQAMLPLLKLDYLDVPHVGRFNVERLTPEQPIPHNLRRDTWARPSRRWASVTPVLLDRFPKRGGRGVQSILARSCQNLALPAPAEVVTDRYSALHGVEPSFRYLAKRAVAGAVSRLYTHVVLQFDEPVEGPILLGAGRHFGMGLLRPVQEGGA